MCTFAYTQFDPRVCSDGQGGAFVAWRDSRNYATSEADIYLQHLTADGFVAPGWPVDGRRVGVNPRAELGQVLVPDGSGGVIIAWLSERSDGLDVYALRLAGDGTVAPGWPDTGLAVAAAPSSQSFVVACTDCAGGAFLAWQDARDGYLNRRVYAQHVTASGSVAAGWPINGRPVSTAPLVEGQPQVAPDAIGGVIVAWSGAYGIFAQRLNPDGTLAPGWPAQGAPVNTLPTCKGFRAVVSDGTGGAYFGWEEIRAGPPEDPCHNAYSDIYCQHLTASGELAPGWPVNGLPVCTAPDLQWTVRMSEDGAGGVFLVWDDYRDYFPAASDLYLQRLLPTGVPAPGWPANGRLVSTAAGFQVAGVLAPDGMGGVFVAFESVDFGSDEGYRATAQHVTATGELAPGWPATGVSLASPPAHQTDATIASVEGGNAIVVWTDQRTGFQGDIYAQKLVGDGPVPVQLALAAVDARPDRVVLTWSGHGAAALEATVYRREASTPWAALGSPAPDGSDRLRFEDRDVIPGARYAYRLGYREGGTEAFTSEVRVEVPRALALALEGFRPNPAQGELVAAFTLPSAERATLDLLDLGGRRVLSREVGSLGPGRHLVRLAPAGDLPAGVYWLRLEQAGRMLAARGLVIK